MEVRELFKWKNPEIRALHLTWIAFFISFYVWFNMAPLATTILKNNAWLTAKDLKIIAICNVALTIPARLITGMALDKYGPRRVFAVLMVICGIPALFFAFGNTLSQLLVSRLVLSSIGASFVVGIHMTALWFKPKDIGFAEGFYAGWGNFGSAGAAMTLPTIALLLWGGDNGWRYAIAVSGLMMMAYGVYYWFAITDGPVGSIHRRPRRVAALEVSTWGDMIQLIVWTIPTVGILSILVWRIRSAGYITDNGALLAYIAIAAVVVFQIVQILRVNVPVLKKGVPEDDKYPFSSVAALNATYFANFGAELAVVSMLPAFFESVWTLTPAAAGMIAASFAFVNLFARPLGGWISDRFSSRKTIMMVYMLGIAVGFFLMALMNSAWPIAIATLVTVCCSMFVQGAEGATFGIIPSIKRRLTGQISGMAGAYGNVGAVFYLFVYTFVTANQFFYIIAGGAFLAFVFCLIMLKEPKGGFAEEYHVSSVDRELEREGNGGGH